MKISKDFLSWYHHTSKVLFQLPRLSVHPSVVRNSSIFLKNFDVIHFKGKLSLRVFSLYNIILSCLPGGIRQYPRRGYFLLSNRFTYEGFLEILFFSFFFHCNFQNKKLFMLISNSFSFEINPFHFTFSTFLSNEILFISKINPFHL